MMKQYDHEVVVVGSGPAGAFTAALLAGQKHDVLLLDKEDFPREKVCGDAISAQVLELLGNAGMIEAINGAIARGVFYPLHLMRLVSPHGYSQTYPLHKSANNYSAVVAPRLYFDDLIRQQAIRAGAAFRQLKATALIYNRDQVSGVSVIKNSSPFEIRAKIVVAADGVASTLAHSLRAGRQHTNTHRAIALRAYASNLELYPHEVEFYIYEGILPGYAWIFPLADNRANIGLGMRLDHYHRKPRNLKKMLDHFLSLPLIKNRIKPGFTIENIASWPLKFGSQPGLKYAFNGALLVGDAGGFISPLTGGGIHRSLLSGQLAAGVIHEALAKNDYTINTLGRFDLLCRKELLKQLRQTYFLTNTLLRFPGLVDLFVRRFTDKSLLARVFTGKL